MSNDKKQLGHVNKFFVANGLSEMRPDTRDVSPYSGFNAELGSDFDENEFSFASGSPRRPIRRDARTVQRPKSLPLKKFPSPKQIRTTNVQRPQQMPTTNFQRPKQIPSKVVSRPKQMPSTIVGRPKTTQTSLGQRSGGIVRNAFSYNPIGLGTNYIKPINPTSQPIVRKRVQLPSNQRRYSQPRRKVVTGQVTNDALVQQFEQNNLQTSVKPPMSRNKKIIIGVSALALAGVIGFIIYKKLKK